MNIQIYFNNTWQEANIHQKEAFIHLTNQHYNTNLTYEYYDDILNKNCIISRENCNTGTYIDNIYLIGDFNNVKVFLVIDSNINWYAARDYQIWSYFTYLQKQQNELSFHSKYSRSPMQGSIELPFDNLPSDICYKIKRNTNNTIIYEKDNLERTTVRISDHEKYRNNYLGYCIRMTEPIECIVFPSSSSSELIFPTDIINIEIDETNTDLQCIICYNIQWNIKYSCGHDKVCLICSKKIYNHHKKLKCPICKEIITKINKL